MFLFFTLRSIILKRNCRCYVYVQLIDEDKAILSSLAKINANGRYDVRISQNAVVNRCVLTQVIIIKFSGAE